MPAKSKVEPFDKLLGQMPDGELAQLAGVTASAVRLRRLKLGVAAWTHGLGLDTDEFDSYLGTMSDNAVAMIAGVSRDAVRTRRIRLGIAAPERPSELRYFDSILGDFTDEIIGILAGVSKQAVTARRRSLGIASYRDQQRASRLIGE